METRLRLILVVAMVILSACAPRVVTRDAVDVRMVLPPMADRTTMREDQTFFMAVPIEDRLPDYPANAPDLEADRTVCVEIVVSEAGEVTSAKQLRSGDGCDGLDPVLDSSFVSATLTAVRDWSFFGAAICTHPLGKSDECEKPGADLRPVAVRLAYQFVFSRDREVVGRRKRAPGA